MLKLGPDRNATSHQGSHFSRDRSTAFVVFWRSGQPSRYVTNQLRAGWYWEWTHIEAQGPFGSSVAAYCDAMDACDKYAASARDAIARRAGLAP